VSGHELARRPAAPAAPPAAPSLRLLCPSCPSCRREAEATLLQGARRSTQGLALLVCGRCCDSAQMPAAQALAGCVRSSGVPGEARLVRVAALHVRGIATQSRGPTRARARSCTPGGRAGGSGAHHARAARRGAGARARAWAAAGAAAARGRAARGLCAGGPHAQRAHPLRLCFQGAAPLAALLSLAECS